MEDFLTFMIKHTPFWAVPFAMICGQFGYSYWLKDIRDIAYAFFGGVLVCTLFLLFYIWHGGPTTAPKAFLKIIGY